ncbi:unnamed protein product [Arctogadus glacialis]
MPPKVDYSELKKVIDALRDEVAAVKEKQIEIHRLLEKLTAIDTENKYRDEKIRELDDQPVNCVISSELLVLRVVSRAVVARPSADSTVAVVLAVGVADIFCVSAQCGLEMSGYHAVHTCSDQLAQLKIN